MRATMPARPRSAPRGILAIASAVVLLAACPAAAQGAQQKPTAIVSLGDSFISGEGGRWQGNVDLSYSPAHDMYGTDRATVCGQAGCTKDPSAVYGNTYLDPTTGKENGCHRSDVAEIVSSGIAADRAVNLACSGAVTDNVLPTSAGGKAFKGQRPQADDLRDLARTHEIKLIQLSIGGNDLGFSGIIESCVKNYLAGPVGGYCWKKWDWEVEEKLAREVPDKIANVIDRIREVMRAAGQPDSSYIFALQSYPSPVPLAGNYRYPESWSGTLSDRYSPGGCPFFNQDTDWARRRVVPGIAEMLDKVATRKGLFYLDLQWAFDGHDVCARNVRQARQGESLTHPVPDRDAEWMRFLSFGIFRPQGQKEESFHPNSYGQQALGNCLREFHRQTQATGYPEFECLNRPGQGVAGMYVERLDQ